MAQDKGKAAVKFAFAAMLILSGCAHGETKFLWRSETTFYPNGMIVVSEGPDKSVTANLVGASTSIITGKPWGVLAGASAQIGESVSRVVELPADAITSNTKTN